MNNQKGTYFIPEQVGFPCNYAIGFDYDEKIDHPWCELEEEDFGLVNAEPSLRMTVEQKCASVHKTKRRHL